MITNWGTCSKNKRNHQALNPGSPAYKTGTLTNLATAPLQNYTPLFVCIKCWLEHKTAKVKCERSYPVCHLKETYSQSKSRLFQLVNEFQPRGRIIQLCSHVAFIHTCPLSMTMTLLQLITVLRRWAMMRVVQLPNAQRMVSWMRRSVSVSMAAVASSSIRIFKKDLKIKSNCYSVDTNYW